MFAIDQLKNTVYIVKSILTLIYFIHNMLNVLKMALLIKSKRKRNKQVEKLNIIVVHADFGLSIGEFYIIIEIF